MSEYLNENTPGVDPEWSSEVILILLNDTFRDPRKVFQRIFVPPILKTPVGPEPAAHAVQAVKNLVG